MRILPLNLVMRLNQLMSSTNFQNTVTLGKTQPFFATSFLRTIQTVKGYQNLHDLVTELKKLSSECEFDNLQVSLIKDRIVYGTRYNSLFFERLLKSKNTTSLRPTQLVVQAMLLRKHTREILRSQLTAHIAKIFQMKLNKSTISFIIF